jgi:hypothetical protein
MGPVDKQNANTMMHTYALSIDNPVMLAYTIKCGCGINCLEMICRVCHDDYCYHGLNTLFDWTLQKLIRGNQCPKNIITYLVTECKVNLYDAMCVAANFKNDYMIDLLASMGVETPPPWHYM